MSSAIPQTWTEVGLQDCTPWGVGVGVLVAVAGWVEVYVKVGSVADGVRVNVFVAVSVGVLVLVGVRVSVRVGVRVGVDVRLAAASLGWVGLTLSLWEQAKGRINMAAPNAAQMTFRISIPPVVIGLQPTSGSSRLFISKIFRNKHK